MSPVFGWFHRFVPVLDYLVDDESDDEDLPEFGDVHDFSFKSTENIGNVSGCT